MDPPGIEPGAFRMRSERDAATPRTHSSINNFMRLYNIALASIHHTAQPSILFSRHLYHKCQILRLCQIRFVLQKTEKWPNIRELWNWVYVPLCFSKNKLKICKVHKRPWGTAQIPTCALLEDYSFLIFKWRTMKLYRPDFYMDE